MKQEHITVLKEESIEFLNIKEDGIYVDATLGYAGDSKEILKRNKKGFLFAFDKDIDAINKSIDILNEIGNNYKIFNTGFINMKEVLEEEGISKVDGVLFDLGVSSPEIDEAKRGFSYMTDSKLDMRMDQNAKLSAYDVVNTYSSSELTRIFREYGEEKHANKIANKIVEAREEKPIETTLELVSIIDKCIPYREKRTGHPAKKVFQALRIEVNNELGEFEKALTDSLSMLNVGGRIVVITFHSLEDRICKNIFKKYTMEDPFYKGMPNIDKDLLPDFRLLTNKPIIPTEREQELNKRSRSAKMRVIERIK